MRQIHAGSLTLFANPASGRHRSLRRRSAFTTALSIVAWKGDGPWINAEGVSQTPWMYWAATFQRSSPRVSCHGKNLRNRPSPKWLHFFDFCRETPLRNACRHSFPRIAECIASTRTGSVGGVSSRRLETRIVFWLFQTPQEILQEVYPNGLQDCGAFISIIPLAVHRSSPGPEHVGRAAERGASARMWKFGRHVGRAERPYGIHEFGGFGERNWHCLFVCLSVCLSVCLFGWLVGWVWFGLVWFGLVWFGLVGLFWFVLLAWLVCFVWFVWFCLFGFVRLFVCFVLFCFVLFCLFVLFCFVLFCFVLFCFVCLFVCLFFFLFCFVLFCFVLFCFVLFCFVLFVCLFVCLFVLRCFVLCCFVLVCLFVCLFVVLWLCLLWFIFVVCVLSCCEFCQMSVRMYVSLFHREASRNSSSFFSWLVATFWGHEK